MRIPDLINGSFEAFGGIAMLGNVFKLLKDKQARGVHYGATAFFTTWGIWNLYYYPSLHQIFSFAGGLLLVITNGIYVTLLIKYRKN